MHIHMAINILKSCQERKKYVEHICEQHLIIDICIEGYNYS